MNTNLAQAAIGAALSSDWTRAAKINLEILKSDPADLDTLNRLGRVYSELGDSTKAVTVYRRVLKIDKYNQIAQKSLARLTTADKRKKIATEVPVPPVAYDFIEEPGKTKIVSLVNVASPRIISAIPPAASLGLIPKRHTVIAYLNDAKNTYVGSLPDDLGHRLEALIRAGNTYEACVKSTGKGFVTIFIKELIRSKKFKNIPSFVPYPTDHKEKAESAEETPVESAKKAVKTPEDQDDEDDVFTQKISQLHMDEEPESQP